jgi:hypothetical protein
MLIRPTAEFGKLLHQSILRGEKKVNGGGLGVGGGELGLSSVRPSINRLNHFKPYRSAAED